MSADKVDHSVKQPTRTLTKSRSSVFVPSLGSMATSKPFGEVLKSSYGDDRAQETRKDSDHDEPEDQLKDSDLEGEEESLKKTAKSEHRKVEAAKKHKAVKGQKPTKTMQAPEARSEQAVDGFKEVAKLTQDAVDQKLATKSVQKSSDLSFVSTNAWGAEQTLNQIDELAPLPKGGHIPPEVLNHMVSQISTYYLDEQRKQQQMFIRFQNSVLGGKLSARINRDAQGNTNIAFEGDQEILAYLEANQEDLGEALRDKGMRFKLRFV